MVKFGILHLHDEIGFGAANYRDRTVIKYVAHTTNLLSYEGSDQKSVKRAFNSMKSSIIHTFVSTNQLCHRRAKS